MIFTRLNRRLATRQLLLAGVTAAAAALVACGGGGGGGGEESNNADSGNAKITVSGPISGFGSIIVNGLRIDDSSAQITLDDSGGQSNDLKLGMIVTIEGEKHANGTTGKATSITTHSLVQGPISSLSGNQLTALGVTVTVNARTLYEDVSGLSGLVAGDTVEVHGIPNGSGGVNATRVEKKSTTEVRLTGTAQHVTASSFQINGITVQYQSSSLDSLPNGVANGMLVRVKGTAPDASTVVATRVRQARLTPSVRENLELELKGIVTRFAWVSDFDVNGQPVTLGAGAEVEGPVALNALVEVEGKVSNGVLVARQVKLEDESQESEFELHSVIADLNPSAKTFTVRDGTITVRWDSSTVFEDSLPQGEGSLSNNLKVEVKGEMSGGVLLATRVKRED